MSNNYKKIANTQNLLKELTRYYNEVDFAQIEKLFAAEKGNFANSTQSINNLLNYEGKIATFYWSVIVKIFNKLYPEFHFVKRGSKSFLGGNGPTAGKSITSKMVIWKMHKLD